MKTKHNLLPFCLLAVLALFTLLTRHAAAHVMPTTDFQSDSITAGGGSVVFSRSATDASGNIYVTGYYQNTFSYGGLSSPVLAANLTNFFLLKTDAAGNGLWLTCATSSAVPVPFVQGTAVAVDTADGVYVGLQTTNGTSSPSTLTLGASNFSISPNSGNSIIAKLDQSNGAFVWSRVDPSAPGTPVLALAVGTNNASIIAAGNFQGTVSFAGTALTSPFGNVDNMFLVKINATTGATIWATDATCASGGYNGLMDMGLDSSGNIYTTGIFGGAMFAGNSYQIISNSTNPTNSSAFVAKWSNPATTVAIPQWAIGSTDTSNSVTSANGLAVDVSSNLYVSFSLARTDPASTNVLGLNLTGTGASGVTQYSQTNGGASEGSIVKFDSNGNILWGEGTLGAAGTTNANTRIAVTTNFVYSLGSFGPGAVTFDGVTTLGTPGDFFIEQLSTSTGGLGLVARVNGSGATPSLLPLDLIASTGTSGDTLSLVGTLAGSPSSNSFVAQYAVGGVGGPFTYTVNGGSNVTITGYDTNAGVNVVIPATILGLPVTGIGADAFFEKLTITSVTIPNSVTSIGSSAFDTCFGLTSVTMGTNVTSISSAAFEFCLSLQSVTIPNTVTNIGDEAFFDCNSLTNATIPNGVISIGSDTFVFCALTSVTIPNSVTNIGFDAFDECFGLTNISVAAANPAYSSLDGSLFDKAQTTLILYAIGLTNQSYSIPVNVTNIFTSAFDGCTNLSSVIIPNSVTSIGDGAFEDCTNLTSMTIPSSVTTIESDVFADCFSLANVTIPNSVTSIGSQAFEGCSSLANVAIPNSVTSIGNQAFEGCSSLANVAIPNSVTNIGSEAFEGCSGLTSMTIPNSVTTIEFDVFAGCSSLTSVTIPNSVSSIGFTAFQSCSNLTSVIIPNSVTSIGVGAFLSCSHLTSVTIPNSVTSIGIQAFQNCSALTNLLFLGNAPSLGSGAFQGVNTTKARVYHVVGTTGWSGTYGGLTVVAITLPAISTQPASQSVAAGGNVTFNVTASGTATLGYQWYFSSAAIGGANGSSYSLNNLTAGNAGDYYVVVTNNFGSVTSSVATLTVTAPFTFTTNNGAITITGYTGTGGAIIIPDFVNGLPVTSIGVTAFQGNTTITSVVISTNVLTIADAAFNNCSVLTNVFIPNSVTNIGNSSFRDCAALVTVTGGTNVMSLGDSTFNGCSSMLAILQSTNLASVGTFTFFNCTALTSIVLPATLTQLNDYMFDGCTGLTNVTLTNTLAAIGNWTFGYCSGVASIIVPNGVTSIGSAAFVACTALTNISLGNSIASIGDGAFNACYALASITLPTSLTSIGVDEFYNCNSLTNIVIPNSITSIGGDAFDYCAALATVTLPNSVTNIGDTAFENCSSLTAVYFQGNAPSLGGANVFTGDNTSATVYYLGGTTGWGATYGGLPTVRFGGAYNQIAEQPLSGGNVQLSFIGNFGTKYALDRSFTLSPAHWIPQITNSTGAGGVLVFTNTPNAATNNFWRFRSVP
jgi:hypothetical protein